MGSQLLKQTASFGCTGGTWLYLTRCSL